MFRFLCDDETIYLSMKPKFYFISVLTLLTLPYCLYKAFKDKLLLYVLNLIMCLWLESYFIYLIRNIDIPKFWLSGLWICLTIYILVKFIFSLPKMQLKKALQNYEYAPELGLEMDDEQLEYIRGYKKPFFMFKL